MTGRQGKADDGNSEDQTDKAKRSGRMGARVNFPFDGDREHLPPHDGKKIAAREKHVAARAKRGVGIVRPRFRNNRRSRALSAGRIVFVRLRIGASRHVRARCSEHAHKIVKSLARGATSRVRHWLRLPLQINARFFVPVAQLDRASDFGSEGWGFESLQARFFSLTNGLFLHRKRHGVLTVFPHQFQDAALSLFLNCDCKLVHGWIERLFL